MNITSNFAKDLCLRYYISLNYTVDTKKARFGPLPTRTVFSSLAASLALQALPYNDGKLKRQAFAVNGLKASF